MIASPFGVECNTGAGVAPEQDSERRGDHLAQGA